jgi:predicted nuclease of predicted toxin-antitoxin system
MITVLVDHNIEGQAIALWGTLSAAGWLELVPLRMVTFVQVDLPSESSDREVWRFAQEHGMILLTSNRRMREADALEQTIREENTTASLPVLTIGNVRRMVEKAYRERCAARLLEIALDLESYLGAGRIFIP